MAFPPNPKRGSSGSQGASVIDINYFFEDDTERDAYFTSNPTELVKGTLISVGLGYQQYNGATWIDVTAIISKLEPHQLTHRRWQSDSIYLDGQTDDKDWRTWNAEGLTPWDYGITATMIAELLKALALHPEDQHRYSLFNKPADQGQFMTIGPDPSMPEDDWGYASDLCTEGDLVDTLSLTGKSVRVYIPQDQLPPQRHSQMKITLQVPAGTVISYVSVASAEVNQSSNVIACDTAHDPVLVKFNGNNGINNAGGASARFESDPVFIGGNILSERGLFIIIDVETGSLPHTQVVGYDDITWGSYIGNGQSHNKKSVTEFEQSNRLVCVRQIKFASSSVWRRFGLCTTGPMNVYVHKDLWLMPWQTRDGISYSSGFASIQDAINVLPKIILHPVTIWVRESDNEYRETINIDNILFSKLTIRGEHYSCGPCMSGEIPNTLQADSRYLRDVEVGDLIHISHYSGTPESTVPSQGYWGTVTNTDEKIYGSIGISMDETITPTNQWTFSICRTKISGADTGETPSRGTVINVNMTGNGEVDIRGLVIKNSTLNGINLSDNGKVSINNCMFYGSPVMIRTGNCLNTAIMRCGFKIDANQRAINVNTSQFVDAKYNTFYGISTTASQGIVSNGMGNTHSTFNIFKGMATGIFVGTGRRNALGNNRIIAGVTTGIQVSPMGIVTGTSSCVNNATTPINPTSGSGVVFIS